MSPSTPPHSPLLSSAPLPPLYASSSPSNDSTSESLASLRTALTSAQTELDRASALLFSPQSSKASRDTHATGATGSTEEAGAATHSLIASIDGRERTEAVLRSLKRESVLSEEGTEESWDRAVSLVGSPRLRVGRPFVFLPTPEPEQALPEQQQEDEEEEEEEEEEDMKIKIKQEDDEGEAELAIIRASRVEEEQAQDEEEEEDIETGLTNSQEERGLESSVTRSQSDFDAWLEETMRLARGDGCSTQTETDDALSSILLTTAGSGFLSPPLRGDNEEGQEEHDGLLPSVLLESQTASFLDLDEAELVEKDEGEMEEEAEEETSGDEEPVTATEIEGIEEKPSEEENSTLPTPSHPTTLGWKVLTFALSAALLYSLIRQPVLPEPVIVEEPTRSLRYVPVNESSIETSQFATPIPLASSLDLPAFALVLTAVAALAALLPIMRPRSSQNEADHGGRRSRATSPLVELNGEDLLEARRLFPIGLSQYSSSQLSAAASTFTSILSLACGPHDKSLASEWLGRTLYRLSRLDIGGDPSFLPRSIAAFERSIRLDPSRASPRASLGRAKYRQGDYKAAVSSLRAALKRDDSLAFAHEYLAKSLSRVSPRPLIASKLVEQHLLRAIDLFPLASSSAHAFLGEYLALHSPRHAQTTAKTHLLAALSLYASYPAVHARLALLASEALDASSTAQHWAAVCATRYSGGAKRDKDLGEAEKACEGVAPWVGWVFATPPGTEERRRVLEKARGEYPHEDLVEALLAIETASNPSTDKSSSSSTPPTVETLISTLEARTTRYPLPQDLLSHGLHSLLLLASSSPFTDSGKAHAEEAREKYGAFMRAFQEGEGGGGGGGGMEKEVGWVARAVWEVETGREEAVEREEAERKKGEKVMKGKGTAREVRETTPTPRRRTRATSAALDEKEEEAEEDVTVKGEKGKKRGRTTAVQKAGVDSGSSTEGEKVLEKVVVLRRSPRKAVKKEEGEARLSCSLDMSRPPSSPPTGSPPFRPPKASSRLASRMAVFEQPAASSSPAGDLSKPREIQPADLMRSTHSNGLSTPSHHRSDYLTPSPARTTSTVRSLSLSPSSPTSRTLHPLPSSSTTTVDSPSTELASYLSNLSIADSSPTPAQPALPRSPLGTPAKLSHEEPGSPTLSRRTQPVEREAKGLKMDLKPQTAADRNGGAKNGGAVEGLGTPAPAVPAKDDGGVDELALLVVSSSITELGMSVGEVNTLIFTIQELRHSTAPAPSLPSSSSSTSIASSSAVDGPSPISDVDAALIKLNSKLESVRAEFTEVEAQVRPLLPEPGSTAPEAAGELGFVRKKWAETLKDWETAQQDAEQLGEELKEDKWLVVFRAVSQQAEDMLRSLEKVLSQSEQFVHDAVSRTAKSSTTSSGLPRSPSAPLSSFGTSPSSSYFSDAAVAQSQLSSFSALQKSLTAKVKYYSPACDRVLKILGKGIADRSTKNGEVLRRYSEMKGRWRNLRERIGRVEAEMKAVEEVLKEQAGRGADRAGQFGSTLTPPRVDAGSPGRVSPFRRLANKMSPRNGLPPDLSPSSSPSRPSRLPASSSSPNFSNLRASTSQYGNLGPSTSSSTAPTPPRPPKSVKRLVSDSTPLSPPATPPRTPHTLGHRRSASAITASVPSSASSSTFGTRSTRPARRPVSPTPSEDRPRWNVSTRRTSEERETLNSSALGRSRPSLASSCYPPSALKSGRHSSLGLRPSSRMSLTSLMSRSYGPSGGGHRPVSPAFSDASSVMHRERPQTPGSRIPMPSPGVPRQSSTPFASLDDPEPTSLLQRAMSPPPAIPRSTSSSRLPLSRSVGPSASSSRSRIPTSGTLSPARAVSPTFSTTSSSYRRVSQTPEPNLMAAAQRLAHVRPPPTPVSRPPPVPRVPSAYRSPVDPQATPRASSSGTFGGARPSYSRPPSALSNSRYGGGGAQTPLPPFTGELSSSSSADYSPNPHDPLDLAISSLTSVLPLQLHLLRLDPPLSRAQAAQVDQFQARYCFALQPIAPHEAKRSGAAVMCKLVDRVGPRAKKGEKKVLARVGGGWQDLEAHLLNVIAAGI